MSDEFDGFEVPDDVEFNVWDEATGYRTCADCCRDCPPESFDAGEAKDSGSRSCARSTRSTPSWTRSEFHGNSYH